MICDNNVFTIYLLHGVKVILYIITSNISKSGTYYTYYTRSEGH